jgi:hypothetical protein
MELSKVIQMNRGETQRCVLALRAGNLFPKLLLQESSSVQSCNWIQAGESRNFSRVCLRAGVVPSQLISQKPERPLAVDEPAIENEKQAHRCPARLIGTDFVKMLAVPEESGERGEQKDCRRKCGHEKRGQPQPPLASAELPQAGFHLLSVENGESLEGRGSWFAVTKT